MRARIQFDGAANPNPGPMGIGAVILDTSGNVLEEISERLPEDGTNNIAEYTALIRALEAAGALGVTSVRVEGDSNLVVQQLLGRFRVTNPRLKPLHEQVAKLSKGFDEFDIAWIPRMKNRRADHLSKRALGTLESGGPSLGSKPDKREHSILCASCRKPTTLSLQRFKDGSEHIRKECAEHGFQGYAPDTPAFRKQATKG